MNWKIRVGYYKIVKATLKMTKTLEAKFSVLTLKKIPRFLQSTSLYIEMEHYTVIKTSLHWGKVRPTFRHKESLPFQEPFHYVSSERFY